MVAGRDHDHTARLAFDQDAVDRALGQPTKGAALSAGADEALKQLRQRGDQAAKMFERQEEAWADARERTKILASIDGRLAKLVELLDKSG